MPALQVRLSQCPDGIETSLKGISVHISKFRSVIELQTHDKNEAVEYVFTDLHDDDRVDVVVKRERGGEWRVVFDNGLPKHEIKAQSGDRWQGIYESWVRMVLHSSRGCGSAKPAPTSPPYRSDVLQALRILNGIEIPAQRDPVS
jgi:hypothetical protein